MPLERDGGQAQYIVCEQPGADGSSLEPLLRWMEENAHRKLTFDGIATRATMSTRTLNRRFREQTGTTTRPGRRSARPWCRPAAGLTAEFIIIDPLDGRRGINGLSHTGAAVVLLSANYTTMLAPYNYVNVYDPRYMNIVSLED
jgi:AraC-like DNA-binding protein